jgi:hypothetical protein
MADKNYCDLVYAWFQCKSEWDGDNRVVPYKMATFVTIGEETGMDRRSASKYVKQLLKIGLLEENDDSKTYVLKTLQSSSAMLVPFTTLRQLVNSLNRNSVNLFVYLLNRYLGNGETSFIVTHKELKSRIGLATTTTSNNIVINDILDILRRLGLIEYELQQVEYDKTNIVVTKVSNVLPE